MSIVSYSAPTFQRRNLSILHSYLALEGSPTPVPAVSEPQRRSLGHVSLPARTQTLPL